jgi:hypothetical protein
MNSDIDNWLLDGELERCARERLRNGSNGDHQSDRYCRCAELIVDGSRVPCPPGHDCAYTRERSKLVDTAVALANAAVSHDSVGWTRAFNIEMERLAAPLLRQSNNSAHERRGV